MSWRKIAQQAVKDRQAVAADNCQLRQELQNALEYVDRFADGIPILTEGPCVTPDGREAYVDPFSSTPMARIKYEHDDDRDDEFFDARTCTSCPEEGVVFPTKSAENAASIRTSPPTGGWRTRIVSTMREVGVILRLTLLLAILWPAVAEADILSKWRIIDLSKNECRPGDSCCPETAGPSNQSSLSRGTSVRIVAWQSGEVQLSSGVVIGPNRVLTADHVLPPAPDSLTVVFPRGQRVAAVIIDRDLGLDLAVLSIPTTGATPYRIATEVPRIGDTLYVGGFGDQSNIWKSSAGVLKSFVTGRDPPGPAGGLMMIAASTRDGDSGGVILNAQYELVGILSAADDFVYGTSCDWIRRFLAGAASPNVPSAMAMPQPDTPPLVDDTPPEPDVPTLTDQLGEFRDEIMATLAAVPAEAVAQLPQAFDSPVSGSPLIEPGLQILMAGLGWTGPPSILALIAGRMAFGAWRRRRARKAEKPLVPTVPNDGVVVDAADEFPGGIATIPRDDTEARQILRLSELEGRSPVHDAIVGRFAFDEIANTIDRQPDGPKADWARQFRDTLEDRFNAVAPVAVFEKTPA